jgi:hypothetical protein
MEEEEVLDARGYIEQFGNDRLFTSWATGSEDAGTGKQVHPNERLGVYATDRTREQGGVVGGYERVASLVSNAQTVVGPLERAVVKVSYFVIVCVCKVCRMADRIVGTHLVLDSCC